jgi:putative transposase
MPYAYPPHDERLPYTGKHHYFLTFSTNHRSPTFLKETHVVLVCTQILRAAREAEFAMTFYCFMPDHVHLIVEGRFGVQLWQRYGYERVIRDDAELALTIGYLLGNPVSAGLADHPSKYPYIGSDRYTIEELLAICEYETRVGPSA